MRIPVEAKTPRRRAIIYARTAGGVSTELQEHHLRRWATNLDIVAVYQDSGTPADGLRTAVAALAGDAAEVIAVSHPAVLANTAGELLDVLRQISLNGAEVVGPDDLTERFRQTASGPTLHLHALAVATRLLADG